MKKLIIALTIFAGVFAISGASVYAAKAVKVAAKPSKDLTITYQLGPQNHDVTINFQNTGNISRIDWQLLYNGDKVLQEAQGTTQVSSGSASTGDLVFGTCSQNVCTYYSKVKNVRLKAFVTVKTGKNYNKNFDISL